MGSFRNFWVEFSNCACDEEPEESRRGKPARPYRGSNESIYQAHGAHNETVETFSRYRRSGEQKVTVQHTVVANKAIVNNFTGVGVPPKNRGDTPCSTNYAEQNQDPTTIDHVDSQPWQMGNVEKTVESPLNRKTSQI